MTRLAWRRRPVGRRYRLMIFDTLLTKGAAALTIALSACEAGRNRDMTREEAQTERRKVYLALLLAWTAGGVDAIGALLLFGLFVGHMSGNSASGGIALAQGDWTQLWPRAALVPLFVAGVLLGGILTEAGIRQRLRATLSWVLAIEVLLLVAWFVSASTLPAAGGVRGAAAWRFLLLLALPAVAMGMQNMGIRQAGGRTVHTTYISGALTNAAEEAVTFLFWLLDHLRGRTRARRLRVLRVAHRQPSFRRFALFGGIFVAYTIGAILCALLDQRWQFRAVLLPLGGLAAAMVWNLCRPIYPWEPATPSPRVAPSRH